ncbi:CMF_collapsed_G0013260.mRNA.1.CDS.1 [Saccharomyces cerevisiae]|nr:CMF_collapsed_G0013260.mRNA.1.CDS.1 [Saccharomyces cerevisiae]
MPQRSRNSKSLLRKNAMTMRLLVSLNPRAAYQNLTIPICHPQSLLKKTTLALLINVGKLTIISKQQYECYYSMVIRNLSEISKKDLSAYSNSIVLPNGLLNSSSNSKEINNFSIDDVNK